MNGWHRGVDNLGDPYPTVHPMPGPAELSQARVLGDLFGDEREFLWACAAHEAGHAVLAQGAGLEVLVVEARMVDGIARASTTTPPWQLPWLTAGAMLAGGEQAALRWLDERGLFTPTRGWATEVLARDDRAQAATSDAGPIDLITDDPDNPQDWRYLGGVARARLNARWGDVLDIAHALIEHGRLTPETYPLNP